ncbi:hypothetical protein [Actinomadura rupiterrae]|uniref:hypothetical protein n=1 Tax=Actinomadura rupiterrae TaxID=559627 RepID=UPI0020A4F4AF|nr:hypothetical protein [Actinomadura rupiterrae]MCP2335117.1 hypothetical protein [Actinomadura rupiterrae]
MSAQPIGPDPRDPADSYEVIHLGGEAAAVVPLDDLRRLKALEKNASPEALEDAEAAATHAYLREWREAGRPGALSHEDAMAILLGNPL